MSSWWMPNQWTPRFKALHSLLTVFMYIAIHKETMERILFGLDWVTRDEIQEKKHIQWNGSEIDG